MAAKKTTSKKTTSKKKVTKKSPAKKAVTKKTVKKAATKKAPVKKKTTTTKAVTKKAPTKKVTKKSPTAKVTKKAPASKVTKKTTKKRVTKASGAKSQVPVEAHDAQGAGLMDDVKPATKPTQRREVINESTGENIAHDHSEEQLDENGEPRKKRRRRRGGRGRRKKNQDGEQQDDHRSETGANDDREQRSDDRDSADRKPKKRQQQPAAQHDEDDVEVGPDVESRVENWEEVFEDETFSDLGLRASVLKGIRACGFNHPTKIQAELIPLVLDGHDVLGQSRTGTGKTAAFALPVIHSVQRAVPFQSFILAPTRELAIQIADEIRQLAKFTPVRTVAIYGGQKIQTQQSKLDNGPEIVVATPGRLMDMRERGHLHFDNCRFAVLDEVDRMLDIGFRDDIRQILKQMPPQRQTMFVSATISPEIESLAQTFMDEPKRLTTTGSSLTVSLVEQFYTSVEPWDKRRLLRHILKTEKPELTIVFCRTKRTVDKVSKYLSENGIDAQGIHGDMYQGKRNTVIKQLRDGELSVMVASDLAARGLDVDGITHVVNYDLPDDPEIYIHRIGRTARAGRNGVAWAFVTPDQGGMLTDIEKLANTHVAPLAYPDFQPGSIPADIRDERARDRTRVDQKRSQNRFEVPEPVQKKTVDESKFPGGIVPTKRPPKALRGRVRTTRSMRDAPKDDAPVDDKKK